MSITKKLVVTLKDDVATPSEHIFIYKGDVGVDIIIELENFNYKIDSISEKNMINRIEAYFKTPQGIVKQYNDEVDVINGDRIKFSFSKNVINDMQIIGQYELQFHLFDKEDNRITIPSYYFYVKKPLHNTSEEQENDESRVDYARVDYSKVKDDIVLFEVSENGYIKTNWQSGDLITSAKLNKIETQLEINTNKINEIQPYDDTEINNSLNRLSESIKNLDIPIKTSELENDSNFTTKTYVDTKIAEASLGGEIDLSSYATKTDLNSKVDKIDGKGLSTNDYTNEEKNKLNGIEEGANNYIHPTRHEASMIIEDSTHRFVTDEEKGGWSNKSEFSGDYNDLTNKPSIPSLDGYATQTYVANAIAEAQLSGGDVDLSGYATKDDLHYHDNKAVLDGITANKVTSWDNKSNFSGNYNDLTNKPSIPTKTSELVNDSTFVTNTELDSKGYLTEHQDISGKVDKVVGKSLISDTEIERLAKVNNYDDTEIKRELNNKANLSDLHQHSNKEILDGITIEKITSWDNKSDFDGNYNNLTNKPSIPTKTSQLTNDSGFLTSIPSEYITETELEAKGYLTEHQDISGLATKSELDSKVDKVTDKGLSTNDLTNTLKSNYDTAYTHSQTSHITTDNVNTAVANYVDEHKAELKGDKGDVGESGKDGSNGKDGTTFTPSVDLEGNLSWTNNGGLTNPTTVNIKGNDGAKGDKGDKGDKGETGQDGITPTLSIGTVTTNNVDSNASVTIGGISPNYILNFTIPKGDKGDIGANGQDGADGLTTSISVNGATYTHADGLITLPNYPTVPTKTSELTNDSGYATETYVETKIAEASLSGGEIDLSGYATKDDLNTKEDKVIGKGLSTNDLTNELKANYDVAYTHSQSTHAPINAQKNSDITKGEIEAKLIGNITTHTHNQYLTEHQDISKLATKTELNNKVDKINGMGLSTNDYTTEEKNKLNGIEEGANNYTHPTTHNATMITQDSTHRFVTDTEKSTWNNKSDFSGSYNDLEDTPTIPTVTNDLTNELKANYDKAYTHSQSAHAPSNAQKNSDITKGEIETKLTGNITSHTHSQYLTSHQDISNLALKSEIPTTLPANGGNANTVSGYTIWVGTQSEYDAIGSKSSTTIYFIKG